MCSPVPCFTITSLVIYSLLFLFPPHQVLLVTLGISECRFLRLVFLCVFLVFPTCVLTLALNRDTIKPSSLVSRCSLTILLTFFSMLVRPLMTSENLYLEMLIRHSLLCSVLTLVCVFCCPALTGSCNKNKQLTVSKNGNIQLFQTEIKCEIWLLTSFE